MHPNLFCSILLYCPTVPLHIFSKSIHYSILFFCTLQFWGLSSVPGRCSTHRFAGSVRWAPSLLACIPWSSYTPLSLYGWCSLFCSGQTPQMLHGALTETHKTRLLTFNQAVTLTGSVIMHEQRWNQLTLNLFWSQLPVLLEKTQDVRFPLRTGLNLSPRYT